MNSVIRQNRNPQSNSLLITSHTKTSVKILQEVQDKNEYQIYNVNSTNKCNSLLRAVKK